MTFPVILRVCHTSPHLPGTHLDPSHPGLIPSPLYGCFLCHPQDAERAPCQQQVSPEPEVREANVATARDFLVRLMMGFGTVDE